MIARDLHTLPHEVDRMPFVDARDIADDMIEHPPAHILASAGLPKRRNEPMTTAQLAKNFGGKVVKRG